MFAPARSKFVAPTDSGSVTVSVCVETGNRAGVIIWASVVGRTGDVQQPAQLWDRTGTVIVPPSGASILVTVLGWVHHNSQNDVCLNTLEVIGSVVVQALVTARVAYIDRGLQNQHLSDVEYNVGSGPDTTVRLCAPRHAQIEFSNVSALYRDEQERRAEVAARELYQWVAGNELQFTDGCKPYFKPDMVEAEWACAGAFTRVPALGGWPQLERLSFDPMVYWPRAVAYAVILLGAHVDLLVASATSDALRVLLVAALTAFAGNYPMFPETVDDRSLGGIKLGRNRDCDDMAMTVVATFNYLKKIPIPNYGNSDMAALSMMLHAFLKQEFTTAACVICRAVAHVANPNIPTSHDSKKGGHVFAILSTAVVEESGQCVDLMRNCAVVEATRVSSPYTQLLRTHVSANGQQLFGRQEEYNISRPGIRSVKPLNVAQYPQCIAAYTTSGTYALTSGGSIGCSLALLQSGGRAANAMLITCPSAAMYDDACRSLSHRVSLDVVDDAVRRYRWHEKLGYDASSDSLSVATVENSANFTVMGDPVAMQCGGKVFNEFTRYAYVII